MNPQLSYQAGMARIDDLHRKAANHALGALARDGRRHRRLGGPHLPKPTLRLPARERLA